MRVLSLLVLCGIIFVTIPAAGRSANPHAPWDELLALEGLTPEAAQLEPNRWRGGGRFALPVFTRVWDDWFQFDPLIQQTGHQVMEASGSGTDLITTAASHLNVAWDMPPAPRVRRVSATQARTLLVNAITAIHATAKAPLDATQQQQLAQQAASVPRELAQQAALILHAVPQAIDGREAMLTACDVTREGIFDRAIRFGSYHGIDEHTLRMVEHADFTALFRSGAVLARAMDTAARMRVSRKKVDCTFDWDTPYGRIVIRGSADDTYAAGSYLLILDAGGNDHYQAGATTENLDNSVSLIMDLAGNDRYEVDNMLEFATGILGYGMLYDLQGNDRYLAPKGGGLGLGIFGVGLLMDRNGDDEYRIQRLGTAAGTCGIGIVNDLSGQDQYFCYHQAQGYAGPRGCGLLLDARGNDNYLADNQDIKYPSPQNGGYNTSLAQGCGFGRRAHPGDGHSLAGGVGVLVDGAGDDQYTAGVFGQGIAYWYAVGMLIDHEGDDKYLGPWYNQGAAAHYAVGGLLDRGGDDHYTLSQTQGQGHGQDFSLGLLHDEGGSDLIVNGSHSLGASFFNGVGLFWKQGGKLNCANSSPGMGVADTARPDSLGLGLMLVERAELTTHPDSPARPHSTWTHPKDPNLPRCYGIGMAR
jgi:hypothetical protein